MVAADGVDDADVVVLNTCCIRENADNKLYGHLGHLKALKDRRPGPADRGGRLPGPEGPATASSGEPPGSTRSGAPTTSAGPPSCSAQARSDGAPVTGDPRRRSARRRRVPLRPAGAAGPAWAAWVTIQIGCDNNCAFCIVPVGTGPGDQPAVRADRRRGGGAGRRGHRRGDPARPERQLLRTGPDDPPARLVPTGATAPG